MPTIPTRKESIPIRDTNLGRVTAADTPGIEEQTRLRQFDTLVKAGVSLGDTLLARQETKKREVNDLAANEAELAFEAASRQKKQEIFQRQGSQAEGAFTEFKQYQTELYNNVTADLTPDQIKLFDPRVSKIGLQDNAQVAAFQVKEHNRRVDANFQASALAKKVRAFDSLTNKKKFDEDIAESIRLEDALLERQGADETERENAKKSSLSSSVSKGITMMSAISLPQAETWFDQALTDGELSTPDSIRVRAALDKRRGANDKDSLLIWAQTNADNLIKKYGENRTAVFEQIERQTSGDKEVALKKEANIRFQQITSQNAENQRAFLRDGKAIVDQSTNATEARRSITEIMGDETATIATANKLDSYIKDVFEKPAGQKNTNPIASDEVYTRINKTLAGTASPDEILDSAEMIAVEYSSKLSPQDLKEVTAYLRNNGFFGKTAYSDLLQSFSNMKEKSVDDVRKKKEDMQEFVAYLNYARPLLPPDKVASPFVLQEISADFFREGKREGQTFRPGTGIFETGLDEFSDDTYLEAARRGEGLAWLPDLGEEEVQVARKLIAEENALRSSQQKLPIADTERNRSRIYKQRVLLLDSAEVK